MHCVAEIACEVSMLTSKARPFLSRSTTLNPQEVIASHSSIQSAKVAPGTQGLTPPQLQLTFLLEPTKSSVSPGVKSPGADAVAHLRHSFLVPIPPLT